MADDRIVAFAGSSAPSGWSLCDGTNGTPDLRDRFAIGKAASGTASVLGSTGGQLGHTHTLSHQHTVTQPSAHADHSVTQPGAHSSLTHSGFDAADHGAASHSGMSVANHSVTKSSSHGTHTSGGSHDHDAHGVDSRGSTSGSVVDALFAPIGKHSSSGSHTHDAHSAHTESVSAHSISSQGANHSAESHSITQPSAHSLSAHAFSVSAHGSHSGAAAASTAVTFDDADPPYYALIFIAAPAGTPIPAGAVLEHGGASIPDDSLECDGASYLRSEKGDLFTAIGTIHGAADGDHFNVPDLRGVHIIGAGGSFSVGDSGGSASHSHTDAGHLHAVTQPSTHADHSVTQPSHSSLSHAGAAISAHSMSHSGFAVGNHTVTQSSGHGTHDSAGGHTHNAHSSIAVGPGGFNTLVGPTTHASDGSHTHDSHGSHSGAALSAHSESQANDHNATHSVTQPDDHPAKSHTGAALSSHSAHANAAVNSGTSSATDTGEAPFISLTYIIKAELGNVPIGSLYKVNQALAPGGTLLAQGQAVSRTTYADLFDEYGETYGPGDGSTTFNLPDTRGRIPRGADGDLGTTGGALDHTHAVSSTHGHTVVQPDTHSAHSATQASDHGSLSHSGADVATHNLSHSGADIANHSATQASAHGAHSSAGGHDHNAHTVVTLLSGSSQSALESPIGKHNTEGAHTHGDNHGHSGFGVNGHNVDQANSHSLSHSVDQPNAHSVSAHSGFAVNAHGAHSGFAVAASGTGTTSTANPPFFVVNYVIQAEADSFRVSRSVVDFDTGTPEFHVTDYEQTLLEVPTTPPSSPIMFVIDAPEMGS